MGYARPGLIQRGFGAMKKCFIIVSPFLIAFAGADRNGNILQRQLYSVCYESGRCLSYLTNIVNGVWSYGISCIQGKDLLDSEGNIKLRLVIASVVMGTYSLIIISYLWKSRQITNRIKYKQESCKTSISDMKKKLKQLPTKKVDEILNYDFCELRSKLQKGEITASETLTVYQEKALKENDRLNFMVEPVKEAEQLAADCDKSPVRDKPLHGIPISIKENYYMKGYHSTGGMSRLLKKGPSDEDGVLIKVLKHQGAVPFVRTNIPQLMMTFECSNPIYGCTVNPHNLKRGPGGSSGGEGAILGAEASILGWGSDIGGSLRIPSHFSGVYCLKPTAGRLGLKSNEELDEGLVQSLINPTPGPMARDVDTLVETMKAVLCPYHFELDPEVPPLPFNKEIYESKRPLRIGYYCNDGYITCIPGVERGLNDAVQALKNQGHELVQFQVPDVTEMFAELFCKVCFGDGTEHVQEMFDEDVIDPTITLLVMVYRLPRILQTCLAHVASLISNDNLAVKQTKAMQGAHSVSEWWELTGRILEFRKSFLKRWKDLRLDAVVCPTMPYVAPPTGAVKFLLAGVTYTTLYNVLNFPSGSVPVTKVTAVDEAKMKHYPCEKGVEKFIKKFFSAGTGGLPVTVQCVCLPYQEELVLRVMKQVETGVKDLKRSDV